MNIAVGQVWQVNWVEGSEVLPSHGRSKRTRTGILTGLEDINGKPVNLHFSLPMLQGRRNTSMTAAELTKLAEKGQAKLLGNLMWSPIES